MSAPSIIGGQVSAGHPSTAHAALEILQDGGTAAEACIAGALAACVAEPLLASLGGSGMLTICPVNEPAQTIDFFSAMPNIGKAPPQFEAVEIDFGSATQTFHIGRGSVAAPMMFDGIRVAAERCSRRPLSELVVPAIALALEGPPVTHQGEEVFRLLWPICERDPETLDAYSFDGRPPKAGSKKPMTGMAQTLREFAEEEHMPRSFRDALLLEFGHAAGGSLCAADLEVQPRVLTPHQFQLADAHIWTSPRLGGRLVEIIARALAKPNQAGSITQHIADACRAGTVAKVAERAFGSTTHLSVVDGDGNAASCTLTNGEGCGHVLQGTQIQLNNFLGEEDLHPDGFFAHPAGYPLPSMIAPTVARTASGDVLALGSGGSNRIRSVVAQVLWRVLVGGAPLHEAILAPRVHAEANSVYFESPDGPAPEALLDGLKNDFDEVSAFPRRAFFFGGVNAVHHGAEGRAAVGDPRRGGVGL